jgi:hypothetical protein
MIALSSPGFAELQQERAKKGRGGRMAAAKKLHDMLEGRFDVPRLRRVKNLQRRMMFRGSQDATALAQVEMDRDHPKPMAWIVSRLVTATRSHP